MIRHSAKVLALASIESSNLMIAQALTTMSVFATFAAASPALAQATDAGLCMQGPLREVAQVAAADRGKPFRVFVSATDSAELEQRGFQQVSCDVSLRDGTGKQAFRDEICRVSLIGGDLIQAQYEHAFGIAPRTLCASAQKVLGASPVTEASEDEGSSGAASEN